jgi:PAS domain S-box-containing protein
MLHRMLRTIHMPRSIGSMSSTAIPDAILVSAFMQQIPDHVYFKDRDSRFVAVSHSLARSFGCSVEQVLGRTDADFFQPADAQVFRDRELQIMESGEPLIDHVTRHSWPDGRETWSLNIAVAIRNEAGEVIGLFGTNKDITATKLLEQAMLANQKLASANEAKNAFLATVSHEIRTPLNGVVGMAGLLLDTRLSDPQRELAETIVQSAQALLGLINNILDFSKIEAGKVDLDLVDFELRPLLEEVMRVITAQAREKGLTLSASTDPAIPRILRGDISRLRQALLNLCGNAVKFTASGDVAVSAEARSRSAQNITIVFNVRDTGIGIPADRLASLFRPFTQVDASTTRRFGGTGLGLSIVKRLVELMGGQVGVESREGAGSHFWFEVSLLIPVQQPETLQPPQPVVRHRSSERATRRILLVEDNPVNQKVALFVLASLGYRADVVADGQQAVLACQRADYELILMDCEMPVLDGYEATRQIRAGEAGARRIPIVALTAHAVMGAEAECRAAGMDAYLTKPLIREQLEEQLERFLQRPCHPPAPGTT